MGDTSQYIEKLFNTLSYPRVKKLDIISAGNTIKMILENNGYRTEVSNGFCTNIETECQKPEFIITAHYDSPFFFLK